MKNSRLEIYVYLLKIGGLYLSFIYMNFTREMMSVFFDGNADTHIRALKLRKKIRNNTEILFEKKQIGHEHY